MAGRAADRMDAADEAAARRLRAIRESLARAVERGNRTADGAAMARIRRGLGAPRPANGAARVVEAIAGDPTFERRLGKKPGQGFIVWT